MKKKPISRKSRALRYAARGLHVVPLYTIEAGRCSCNDGSDCSRPGKHPITRHGVKDATTKRSQIRDWWKANPDANIGIAAGGGSGIIVLDIDPRNGGDRNLKRLKKRLGPLPDTVTALTGGGGQHLLFRYPSFAVRKDTSGKKFGKGVDVLSDSCIMVAPPSRHATGKRYRWEEGKSFRDLEPAKLPKIWLDRLRGDGSTES
jgi:putative DNA primase/helicase